MKKIFICIFSLFALHAQANCDESWASAKYEQNLHLFKVADKTFFYSLPNDDSRNSKLFLIKNDTFTGFLDSGDFEFGQFTRKDGSIVMGWIKKESLVELKGSIKVDLNASDFSIYSPNGNINLNSSFEMFDKKWGECGKNEQLETGAWSNFISKGDKNYKYFDYYWEGFSIRTSNINYEQLGYDFDTYRITTITVVSNKYMTSRGIYVGMTKNDIINAYGNPSKMSETLVSYSFKYNSLDFKLEGDVIKTITLDEAIL